MQVIALVLALHAAAAPAPAAKKAVSSASLTRLFEVPLGFGSSGWELNGSHEKGWITIHDLITGRPVGRIEASTEESLGPDDGFVLEPQGFSDDKRFIFAASLLVREQYGRGKGEVLVYSVEEEKVLRRIALPEGPCAREIGIQSRCPKARFVRMSPDGRTLVVHSESYSAVCRNALSGCVQTERLAAYREDGSKAWEETFETTYGAEYKNTTRGSRSVNEANNFLPDGRFVGIAADASSCAVIEIPSRKRVAFLEDCSSKDNPYVRGAYAQSSLYDRTVIKTWSMPDGKLTGRVELDADPALKHDLAGGHGGAVLLDLVKQGDRQRLDVWHMPSGKRLHSLDGEEVQKMQSVHGLSNDGRRLHYSLKPDWKGAIGRLDLDPPLKPYVAPGAVAAHVPPAPAAPAPAPRALPDVDTPPLTDAKLDPDAVAVVIGVEKYRMAGLPGVDFAARDAQAMHRYLTEAMGFDPRNALLLTDAQAGKADLEKHLGKWLSNRATAKSRVFVYYAGHGAPDPATGEAYLVPHDGDPAYLEETGYPLAKLYASLAKLPTKDVSVVLDACFSGQGGRSLLAKGARPLVNVKTAVPAASTARVIAAAAGNQVSMSQPEARHGLLTYYLLDGLRGAADADKDGAVTASEAFAYAAPAVERAARLQNAEQTPKALPSTEALSAGGPWIRLKQR